VNARSRLRIDESLGEAIALRREIETWRFSWEEIDAMGVHRRHRSCDGDR